MDFIEKKLKNGTVFFVLLLLGFLIYSNVINGPFSFDDINFVVFNKYVHSLSNFFNYFTSNLETGAGIQLHLQLHNNFYRPLQQLAHGIIYHFFGLKYQAYHILSISVHIINSFLVFLFIKRLKFSKTASLFASLIFLVHPVLVEAVSYISGLSDPLSFMFALSGILVYLDIYDAGDSKRTLINAFCAITLFLLSIFSKESAIVFFGLIVLLSIFYWKNYSKEEKKVRSFNILLYFVMVCTYIVLKFTVLNFSKGSFGLLTDHNNPYYQHLYIRLFTFISILGNYLKLLFLPIQLYLDKPYILFDTLLTPQGIFGLLILITSFITAIFSFFKRKVLFLGISWFFICISPFMGWIPLNATHLEHWLYFPIVGVLIIFAGAFDSIINSKTKIFVIYVLCLILTLFSIRVIKRNNEWADEIKFYKNELIYNPNSQRIHSNLALKYFVEKNYPESIKQYKIAISLIDAYPECHNNLGVMYMSQGMYGLAQKEFNSALKIEPNFIYSLNGLKQLSSVKKND